MKQIRMLTDNSNLALSNKYLYVTIQCFEPKVSNVKGFFLFNINSNKNRVVFRNNFFIWK